MTMKTLPLDWPVMRFIKVLREHHADLTARYQIRSLGVFGSYVRNEQHADSDLDVLISFTRTPSLFEICMLQDELSNLLGVSVDLVMKSALKPHIGQRILSEVVEV